mmetsp:Transcript_25416/g.52901  ORF Transcript_25416/g.52901 Transcript_25416/m.52901 type:complete len:100 (+) Transcript_25416:791-1090(+)
MAHRLMAKPRNAAPQYPKRMVLQTKGERQKEARSTFVVVNDWTYIPIQETTNLKATIDLPKYQQLLGRAGERLVSPTGSDSINLIYQFREYSSLSFSIE